MRFSVPQYITIEDKLMGVLTFRQLFLLLGAFFISFISFKILPSFIAMVIAFFAFITAVALGWIQLNGKPLLNQMSKVFEYFFSFAGKKYLWRPSPGIITKSIEIPIIEKYFPIEIEEEETFIKRVPVVMPKEQFPIESVPTEKIIVKKPSSISRVVKTPAEVHIETKKRETASISKPLIKYIQYSHKHPANPFNPYRNFPLPHFPTMRQ
ncbi:MAG: PrgI family protein [Patescibacteria group bacterium]